MIGVKHINATAIVMARQMRDANSTVSGDIATAAMGSQQATAPARSADL